MKLRNLNGAIRKASGDVGVATIMPGGRSIIFRVKRGQAIEDLKQAYSEALEETGLTVDENGILVADFVEGDFPVTDDVYADARQRPMPDDGVCDYPGCTEDAVEEDLSTGARRCAKHAGRAIVPVDEDDLLDGDHVQAFLDTATAYDDDDLLG